MASYGCPKIPVDDRLKELPFGIAVAVCIAIAKVCMKHQKRSNGESNPGLPRTGEGVRLTGGDTNHFSISEVVAPGEK